MRKGFYIIFIILILMGCKKEDVETFQSEDNRIGEPELINLAVLHDYENQDLELEVKDNLMDKMNHGIQVFHNEDPQAHYRDLEFEYTYYSTPYGFILFFGASSGNLSVLEQEYLWCAETLYLIKEDSVIPCGTNWSIRDEKPRLRSIKYDGQFYEIDVTDEYRFTFSHDEKF